MFFSDKMVNNRLINVFALFRLLGNNTTCEELVRSLVLFFFYPKNLIFVEVSPWNYNTSNYDCFSCSTIWPLVCITFSSCGYSEIELARCEVWWSKKLCSSNKRNWRNLIVTFIQWNLKKRTEKDINRHKLLAITFAKFFLSCYNAPSWLVRLKKQGFNASQAYEYFVLRAQKIALSLGYEVVNW